MHMECQGTRRPVGISTDELFPVAVGRLLGGAHNTVSRVCVPLCPSRVLSTALPASCCHLVMQLMTQQSGWTRKNLSSLAASHIVRDAVLTHMLSLSPHGKNHGLSRSLLALRCAALGER